MKSPSSQDIGHCKTTYSYYRIYQNWQGKLWSWLDYISHGQHTLQLLSYTALLTHRTVGRKFTSLIESGVFGWLKKKLVTLQNWSLAFNSRGTLGPRGMRGEVWNNFVQVPSTKSGLCICAFSALFLSPVIFCKHPRSQQRTFFSQKEERHSWGLLSLFPFLLCSRNSGLISLCVFLILHRELYVCV